MNIIWMAIAGIIVGGVAKLIKPGKEPGGIWMTMLFGVLGTFLGNFIRGILGSDDTSGFNLLNPFDWFFAVGGSILVIIIWQKWVAPAIAKK